MGKSVDDGEEKPRRLDGERGVELRMSEQGAMAEPSGTWPLPVTARSSIKGMHESLEFLRHGHGEFVTLRIVVGESEAAEFVVEADDIFDALRRLGFYCGD